MPAIKLVASGDSIITRRLSSATRELGRRVMADCDVAVTNLEIMCPRAPRVPSSILQGFALAAPESVLDELAGIGFNLFSVANNHASDYTHQGLLDTMAALDARGYVYAGGGRTLADARRANYLNAANGRVAFIAATSSNARLAAAADPGLADVGRPGVNPLRFNTRYLLAADRFRELTAALEPLGYTSTSRSATFPGVNLLYPDRGLYQPTRDPHAIYVEGIQFAEGPSNRVETKCEAVDLDALCAEVERAAGAAELVVVSLHCHEGPGGTWNTADSADFVREAAHAVIKAGAHAVVGHGSHCLRAVEIVQGRPIFYSLGNFFFELDSMGSLPRDVLAQQSLALETTTKAFMEHLSPVTPTGERVGMLAHAALWESVMAVGKFEGGRWTEIAVEPIVLRSTDPNDLRGLGSPCTPDREKAAAILERLAALCKPYGSTVQIERGGEHPRGIIKAQ